MVNLLRCNFADTRAADEIVSQFVIKLTDSMPIDYCLATTLCEPSLSAVATTTATTSTSSASTVSTVAQPPAPAPAQSPAAGVVAVTSPPSTVATSAPSPSADSMTLTMTFATTLTAAANSATVTPPASAGTPLVASPLLSLPSPQSLFQLQQQHFHQPLPLALSSLGLPSPASLPGPLAMPSAQPKAAQPQLAQSKAFFPCDNCGNVYNYKTSLARHVRFECGKDPQFKCPFCEHRTKHKSSLTTHIDCKHRQELLFDENRYWREFYSLTKTQ